MVNALGIIAYNDPSLYIRGLSKFRPVAAYSYVGRYRLVDIPISNMANSGLQHIQVYTNGDPKVLFDHIGSARHYNINNKHGHIGIIPVFTDGTRPEFVSDMETYYRNLPEIEDDGNDYVIIAPVNFVYKANYNDLLQTHMKSGNDVTVLYKHIESAELNHYFLNAPCLELKGKKEVGRFYKYIGGETAIDMSLATYILSKKTFVELVKRSHEYSAMFWLTDILNTAIEQTSDFKVGALPYTNPVFPILDLKSYFRSNMEMLNEQNMSFFNDVNWPIYTRTNDSAPTIYIGEGTSQGALISNGCEIAGEVKGSILGRGVKVGKGAIIDNSLVLPGAVIGDNVMLTNAIVDKDAQIIHKKEVSGYESDPIYIERREIV